MQHAIYDFDKWHILCTMELGASPPVLENMLKLLPPIAVSTFECRKWILSSTISDNIWAYFLPPDYLQTNETANQMTLCSFWISTEMWLIYLKLILVGVLRLTNPVPCLFQDHVNVITKKTLEWGLWTWQPVGGFVATNMDTETGQLACSYWCQSAHPQLHGYQLNLVCDTIWSYVLL